MSGRVSVVMCTYNGARYLEAQLDSLLAQIYPLHEIIIQDDGSTDNTRKILESYAHRSPLISLYHNEGKHGINANFFSAMRRATGDFIAVCDQDDIWLPHKLERQMEEIGNHLLCSCFSKPFSDDGFPIAWDGRRPNYHLLRVVFIGVLAGHTLLFRRELLDWLPEGDSCPFLYDWQLQTVAAAAESIVFIPEVLVNFRRHRDAATAVLPTGHKVVSHQAFNYLRITLLHHPVLQQCLRVRFSIIQNILRPLPFDTPSLREGLRFCALERSRSFLDYFRLTAFCLKHRRYLSHAEEHRPLVAILRALYFPLSSGYYGRGVLTNKKERELIEKLSKQGSELTS